MSTISGYRDHERIHPAFGQIFDTHLPLHIKKKREYIYKPGVLKELEIREIGISLQIAVRKCLHQCAKSTKQVRQYRLTLPHTVINLLSVSLYISLYPCWS